MDLDKLVKEKNIKIDKGKRDDSVIRKNQFAFKAITDGLKQSDIKNFPEDEIPFIETPNKDLPLGISESSHLVGINEANSRQEVSKKKSLSKQKVGKEKAVSSHIVSTSKAKGRQNKQDAQFSKTPCRLDYRLLKGIGKQIMARLIDANGVEGTQVINSELAQELGISKEHFFSAIDRLKERGFIRFESHYGWRIYFINPAILVD